MVTLRDADINDFEILTYWDSFPHIIASDPNDDWGWENELSRKPFWREQLIAEVNGKAIGFVQIIDPYFEDSHYWGNIEQNLRAIDIWIGEPDYLGKGYGTKIMRQAIEKCFESQNVTAIIIDPLESNSDAIRFYERLGFKFLRKQQFSEDKCLVYSLSRTDWFELKA